MNKVIDKCFFMCYNSSVHMITQSVFYIECRVFLRDSAFSMKEILWDRNETINKFHKWRTYL